MQAHRDVRVIHMWSGQAESFKTPSRSSIPDGWDVDRLSAILILVSWFGGFIAVAFLWLAERAAPKIRRAGVARPPNVAFGILGRFVTAATYSWLYDDLVRLVYRIQLFSIADWPVPDGLKLAIGFLLIDLVSYLNHRVSHTLSWLWRMHKVHHVDPLVTGSTGLLHHPFEIVYAFVVLLVVAVLFGVPIGAMLIYASVSAVYAIFAHANLALPDGINRWAGLVLVTPDIHRIHHSIDATLYNSNYGNVLSIWDRLLGTFRAAGGAGERAMELGLAETKAGGVRWLPLLLAPFR